MLIGYARVSTNDQDLTQQVTELEGAGCEQIYSEKVSGKNMSGRQALTDLLKYVRKDDVVVVTKLDRLARSLRDMLTIIDQIDKQGAGIKSLAESVIDTTSAAGRMVYQFFGVVAEFERNRIRERTLDGLAQAKLKGKAFGRPQSLNATQILQLRALRAGGSSYQELTETFGISRASIYRYCKQ